MSLKTGKMRMPENEQELKYSRLREAMRGDNADACLISLNIHHYYFTGEVFNGYLYITTESGPCYFLIRPSGPDAENRYNIRKPEEIPGILAGLGISLPRRLWLEADELPYSAYVRLKHIFRPESEGNASAAFRQLRMIKTPWEIRQLRHSARQHEAVYREIPACYRPGMTDLELQIAVENRMRQHGSIGHFRAFGANMDIFMGSLLAGENAGTPSPFDFALGGAGMHASTPIGANGTVLAEGMSVMVDMSGNYTAYMTDMTRVFSVGKLKDEAYAAHRVALEMENWLEEQARPGMICSDIYGYALETARQAGWGENFMGTRLQARFVGHGVGLQINELPVLAPRCDTPLQPGMVFAFEPKFVLPGTGAVGIENTWLVTEGGVEKLTCLPEEIIPLS